MAAVYDLKYFGLYQVTTKSDDLMLRSAPSTAGAVKASMPKGSLVWGKGLADNNFLLCTYLSAADEASGYASLNYLTEVDG